MPPDELATLIEHRLTYVVEQVDRVARAFLLGHDTSWPTPAPPRTPTASDLERHIAAWRPIVPDDPPARAALARALAARFPLAPSSTPRTVAALGLAEASVAAAHQAAFGQPIEALWSDRPPTPAPPPDPTDLLSHELAGEVEWVALPRGALLCREGDPGDAMFVVVAGRLRVFVAGRGDRHPDRVEERLIGEIGPGDAVGEMALISGQPRTATLYASRDSELVRLPRAAFERLVERHPRFLLNVTRQTVDRLQRSGAGTRARTHPRTIAVAPAGRDAPLAAAAERLASALGRIGPTALVSRASADARLGEGAVDRLELDPTDGRLREWLVGLEREHQYVVYESDPVPSAWTTCCLHQADHLVLVAWADGSPELSEVEQRQPTPDRHAGASRGLLLLHRRRAIASGRTRPWLERRDLDLHHHAHLDSAADFGRVARRTIGRAVGLALGGGGARGFAHIGALQALRDCGVPIDVVGGTSMGAMIAGQLALGWSREEMLAAFGRFARRPRPRFDLTVPLVALSSGRQITAGLAEMCGDVQIEDLWTELFCVSSNLTRGEVAVHTRGPLRKYLRASASVAGLLPPVTDRGDLLVDGGILNNMPADVVRRLCPEGPVIAVNVDPEVGLRSDVDYGETLTAFELVRARTRQRSHRPRVPGIYDILERVTMLGSIRQSAELARSTIDLYLHPRTDEVGFTAVAKMEQLADQSYRYALPLVRSWKDERADAASWDDA